MELEFLELPGKGVGVSVVEENTLFLETHLQCAHPFHKLFI